MKNFLPETIKSIRNSYGNICLETLESLADTVEETEAESVEMVMSYDTGKEEGMATFFPEIVMRVRRSK